MKYFIYILVLIAIISCNGKNEYYVIYQKEYNCNSVKPMTLAVQILKCVKETRIVKTNKSNCYLTRTIVEDCNRILKTVHCVTEYIPYVQQRAATGKRMYPGFPRLIPCNKALLQDQIEACKAIDLSK